MVTYSTTVIKCNVTAYFYTYTYTRLIITSSSAIAEGPLKSVEILSAAAQLYEKSHLTSPFMYYKNRR